MASFNPPSISGGSGSSTLNITTSLCSTPAGAYTLTITGTSGGASHSTTVTVVVNAPVNDFTLAATPSSQAVIAGSGTTYTATVSAVNCFQGNVTFSVSGLPSGATGGFDPASVTGSGSSTLSVSASGMTPPGSYPLIITGADGGGLSHSANVTLVVNSTGGGLPPGWIDTDVGTPGLAGGATFSSGAFTVNGGGADIWGRSDNFNYASESVSGNVTITARVASQQNTNAWAKSGVMIRESAAANSGFVHVFVTPGHGVNMQYRASTGAGAAQLGQVAGPVAPYWVRLARSGSTFTGSTSADGVTWTPVGTINVTMASGAQAGLSVTAHNNTALNTSTFDNVNIQ